MEDSRLHHLVIEERKLHYRVKLLAPCMASCGVVLVLFPRVASRSIRRASFPHTAVNLGTFSANRAAAFVRHPLDRLVSQWITQNSPTRKRSIEGVETFTDFIEVLAQPQEDVHYMSQSALLMNQAKGRPLELDFVGRFENLIEDWSRFLEWSGWVTEDPFPDPQETKSKRDADWRRYYNKEQLKMARKLLREDLARWYAE